jgi:hypothetical protein
VSDPHHKHNSFSKCKEMAIVVAAAANDYTVNQQTHMCKLVRARMPLIYPTSSWNLNHVAFSS